MKRLEITQDIAIGANKPVVLVAGPCVIETEQHLRSVCQQIQDIAAKLEVPYIMKSSYDKANRSSIESYRGPGLEKGLEILATTTERLGVPVLTDVHDVSQVSRVAEVADIIQVPAFLCRQTDLLCEVAKTKKVVNVKKGQFLAPDDAKNIIGKLEAAGNNRIMLTERGAIFGYHNLVVDMRSFPIMRSFGYPVMFDATHSLQLPGGLGKSTGGQREYIAHLCRAACATGVDAIFMEVHDDPNKAPCDGSNMLALTDLPGVLRQIKQLDKMVKEERWI